MSNYKIAHRRSLKDPRGFWGEAAQQIDWIKPPQEVLDDSNPPFYRWFRGGEINTCHNAIDRHADGGRGEQAAIIYDSPVADCKRTLTYRELRDAVARFAGAIKNRGVGKGDRVIIYMPMIPETVIAMMACARIGAVHSVVFGGFAAPELATRIDDSKPKLILSASCGIEPNRVVEYKPLLDRAIELSSHKPDACIILPRPQSDKFEMRTGRDFNWEEEAAAANPVGCESLAATDPLYILYTSGTTGMPKGIVRDNGGHAVALNWSMPNIYGIRPGEVWWSASDVGWIVGHSYIVYAPLLAGCTTIIYEGKPVGTPDAGAFWRVISEHRAVSMFTAPTAFRAIRQADPEGELISNYDMSHFRALFLAGERCDPDTLNWAAEKLQVPIIDHWWQTETGWSICANCIGIEKLPIKPGSAGPAAPGSDVRILDESGKEAADGDIGNIVVKLPLPPGTFPTLWQNEARYRESYMSRYEGFYLTGDAGFRDSDGYVSVMSRIDDIINVAGHRLSTGAIEEALASHPAVAECAVIGTADSLKGELPLGFVALKRGATISEDQLRTELIATVREKIGPVAAFRNVCIVARLPKTRSGKILRGTMKKIADGESFSAPATIDDPAILDEIKKSLTAIGYAKESA